MKEQGMNKRKKMIILFYSLLLLIFLVLIGGCKSDKSKEAQEKKAQESFEKFQKYYNELLLKEAEKRGIKDKIQEGLDRQEQEKKEWSEEQEKDIKKILGAPGKIVKDKYLEELFAPEFPYEIISIVDQSSSRYVIIKASQRIKQEQKNQYIFQTLTGRGVSVHRWIDPHSGRVEEFMITIIKKTENPGVIAYSQNLIPQPPNPKETKWGLKEALRFKDNHIIIEITPEFGHEFKLGVIYPKNDKEGPEPEDFLETPENFVRYPNSKRYRVYYHDKNEPRAPVTVTYITPDSLEEVINFFIQKRKEYYDDNPHMRKDSTYNKREEEYYLRSDLLPHLRIFGLMDIGTQVHWLGFTDLTKDKTIDITLMQSANANLKDYVEIKIDLYGGLKR